jgi:tetratricopeptide (TPR) repeat protein
MKQLLIATLTLILFSNNIYSQVSDSSLKEIYPLKYTFEKAEYFLKKGEYDKVVWFYINLFSENKGRVTDLSILLSAKLDTINFYNFIKNSFEKYYFEDPELKTDLQDGFYNNPEKLIVKGKWAEELIQYIYRADGPMYSAEDYNKRGLIKYNNLKDKESIMDYDKAIKLDSTFCSSYYNRALSKKELGQIQSACDDWKKALNLGLFEAAEMIKRYCK